MWRRHPLWACVALRHRRQCQCLCQLRPSRSSSPFQAQEEAAADQDNPPCASSEASDGVFQGAPKGRQQKGETGPGTRIFAVFCRFSLIFGSLCKSRDLGVADLRRKPKETADFRRKPQIFAETGFSHLLSPFWRAPSFDGGKQEVPLKV